MKKILITNNSFLIDKKYDLVYTDSPFVVEKYPEAIYLETLLHKNFDQDVSHIRSKGYEINKEIINFFLSEYKNRNINILNIKVDFTNIYINVVKLINLIALYPNEEITIAVTSDELHNYNSPDVLEGIANRFVNVYYLISDLAKIKNVKLVCKNKKISFPLGHSTINSWFLRLVDLDKKVLLFNLLKKLNLLNTVKKKKIYIYKKSPVIREIEPYLYDLGFYFVDMPELNFSYQNKDSDNKYEDLKNILAKFFDDNIIYNTFKIVILEMYKKRINYYLQKKNYTEDYISKLDKSIKFILTNTINGFDSHIFAKQLQKTGYKIIDTYHGLSTGMQRKEDIDWYECEAPDITLCHNNSEKDMCNELVPNALVYPISLVQEAKNKRFKFLKRFQVNKLLKIKEDTNIFYPSCIYPYNNVTNYNYRQSDRLIFEFEKKMISLLSKLNKRVIYKNYPMRSYIDSNSLIEYAKNLKNIKVIDKSFDFRFVSSIGDIFILGHLGGSSTISWMLGENKPIVYLHTNKSRFLSEKAKKIIDKMFIVINIDKENWTDDLSLLLNKPYKELVNLWKEKKIYRDQFDNEWLMGTNLHAGKLASKYIERFILENN